MNNEAHDREEFSLLELNNRIKKVLVGSFSDSYWVKAEMCDVRVNASSGHCYLELIEKHSVTGRIIARARANIWAKTFAFLKPHFEMETGRAFESGLEVMLKVIVEYHELYGVSYTVIDIDPTYTLGEIMRKRIEIIRWLQEDGVFTLNKELDFPELPSRIAVITSPTAAGYEDFIDHLNNNTRKFVFYVKLFPAYMQGEKVEESIIGALDRIYTSIEHFDLVVIIRGGGSTSDLNCFDSYQLASNCAQFPLPVLTGIGHERDDSILDLVAHKRLKTPTAVAEFLINYLESAAFELEDLRSAVTGSMSELLEKEKRMLQLMGARFPGITVNRIEKERSFLQAIGNHLQVGSISLVSRSKADIVALQNRLKHLVYAKVAKDGQYLDLTEQYIQMVSPEYILKRGYTLVMKEGAIIKSVNQLQENDLLDIRFTDGTVTTKLLKK